MRSCLRLRVAGAAVAAVTGMTVLSGFPVADAATTQYWYGTVTKISDGDTIYVDVIGDGKAAVPVRNAGIQATEMHGVSGAAECHAAQASAKMQSLVPIGTKVRLAAYYASSTSGTDPAGATRLLRYVDKYNSATGKYDVDIQLALLKAGLVMWEPDPVESARVSAYMKPMQEAMVARIGLFDTNYCGEGPVQGTPMPMWIHYDADGDDTVMNKEWIHLMNRAAYDVNLSGWKLRDPSHTFYQGGTYFTFPTGSILPAGKTLTVFPGQGTNDVTARRFFLGRSTGAIFPNVTDPSLGYPGKAIYLLDPQLDFRGWTVYPCQVSCARPPVHVSYVRYNTADEYVDIVTDSGATTGVDLSGVEVTNDGWTREINPGTYIYPGETLRVYCQQQGTDSRLTQHWRHTGYMLEDSGDTVVLRTAGSVALSTYTWGSG